MSLTPEEIKELEKAVEEWKQQGRDPEHVYGVKNFLSGRGRGAIEEIASARETKLLESLLEEIEEEMRTHKHSAGCGEVCRALLKLADNTKAKIQEKQ